MFVIISAMIIKIGVTIWCLVKFCYNSIKHLATKMRPFELALGVEAKQPMDLTIPRTRGTCHKGDKEAKNMAKEREERKTWAIKLLEKA